MGHHRKRAAAAAALALATALSITATASADNVVHYVSRPDLQPPKLTVNASGRGQAPGFIFVANFQNKFINSPLVGQGGALILDNKGHLVWSRPVAAGVDTLNLEAQRYQGKPVLTWWQGVVSGKTGEMTGTWYVGNDRYKPIARIAGANGWDPSAHEFIITSRGTALVTAYKHVPADTTAVGGTENGQLLDSGVLEFDIKTGRLLHEWSAAAHIPMDQSYSRTSPQNPNAFDAYHINSIDVDAAGNWLVSMRNTWAIYKVDAKTGAILWTLGGKANSFGFGDNVHFAFQHNARWLPNGQVSMFDNECCAIIPQPDGTVKPGPAVNGNSRGLVIKLDEAKKTAAFVFDRKLYELVSGTQGNLQTLPNGNEMIGWGQQPFFSEFSKAGKLLLSIRFPDPDISYRAYRLPWHGRPSGRPAVAVRAVSGGRTRVYISWNGATDVVSYQVLSGRSSRKLALVKRVHRGGFETAVSVHGKGLLYRVKAVDARGRVLGTSALITRSGGNTKGTEPAPVY
ncbi:MAG: arylsulfotransferase family protein [Thermoleophilaceae bacterium]